MNYVGVGVSPEGQKVFNAIVKTLVQLQIHNIPKILNIIHYASDQIEVVNHKVFSLLQKKLCFLNGINITACNPR